VIHRHWKTALRFVPPVLLGVILWREKPWTVELSAGAPWAVAAVVAVNLGISLPLKAARWRVALQDRPPFLQALAATFEGVFANAAIGLGSGDLIRAARLRREGRFGLDYAATLAERGAEALAFALMLFATALVARLGALALALAGAIVAAYVGLLVAGRVLLPSLGRWPRFARALAAGLEASTPRRVAIMVAISLVGWSCEVVTLVLMQRAFDIAPSIPTAMLTLVGINAAIAVPSAAGNFGTYEAGASMALIASGVGRDVAVAYAFTYHLSHVIPVAAVATAIYFIRR